MKRIISILLIVLLICTLTACSKQPVGSSEPSSTPQESSEPTPEREPYKPMDIFGEEFNPFGMDSPFTVFAASFNKGSAKLGKDQFVLSMTGGGNMYACVAYLLDVSGLGLDEGKKFERLEEYRSNGYFLEFTGTNGQVITIRQADPNDDRYEYVEADGQHDFTGGGCVIDITYFINDADVEKYTKLVSDNYNMAALTPITDYFDTNTDFSECGIKVNVHKEEARAYTVYYVTDVKTVQQSMQANGDAPWWEWNGMMQTAFIYDGMDSKLTFDIKGGAITVEQLDVNFNKPPVADGSLTALGFGFDEAGVCGVYEEREPHYKSIAISKPEWGDFADDWNIEYMDADVNGYSLRITYHASEGRYHISVDKDGETCAYDTYPEKDEKGWEYPDIDTVHRMFNDAFGTKEKELYSVPLEYFEQFVQEHFGMSVDELYAAQKQ